MIITLNKFADRPGKLDTLTCSRCAVYTIRCRPLIVITAPKSVHTRSRTIHAYNMHTRLGIHIRVLCSCIYLLYAIILPSLYIYADDKYFITSRVYTCRKIDKSYRKQFILFAGCFFFLSVFSISLTTQY